MSDDFDDVRKKRLNELAQQRTGSDKPAVSVSDSGPKSSLPPTSPAPAKPVTRVSLSLLCDHASYQHQAPALPLRLPMVGSSGVPAGVLAFHSYPPLLCASSLCCKSKTFLEIGFQVVILQNWTAMESSPSQDAFKFQQSYTFVCKVSCPNCFLRASLLTRRIPSLSLSANLQPPHWMAADIRHVRCLAVNSGHSRGQCRQARREQASP